MNGGSAARQEPGSASSVNGSRFALNPFSARRRSYAGRAIRIQHTPLGDACLPSEIFPFIGPRLDAHAPRLPSSSCWPAAQPRLRCPLLAAPPVKTPRQLLPRKRSPTRQQPNRQRKQRQKRQLLPKLRRTRMPQTKPLQRLQPGKPPKPRQPRTRPLQRPQRKRPPRPPPLPRRRPSPCRGRIRAATPTTQGACPSLQMWTAPAVAATGPRMCAGPSRSLAAISTAWTRTTTESAASGRTRSDSGADLDQFFALLPQPARQFGVVGLGGSLGQGPLGVVGAGDPVRSCGAVDEPEHGVGPLVRAQHEAVQQGGVGVPPRTPGLRCEVGADH